MELLEEAEAEEEEDVEMGKEEEEEEEDEEEEEGDFFFIVTMFLHFDHFFSYSFYFVCFLPLTHENKS